MPTNYRDEIRRRWRRTVTWLSGIHWFAVLALVAAIVSVVLSTAWHLTTEQGMAIGALALTLAVLSLREE